MNTADAYALRERFSFPGGRPPRVAVGLLWQETNCFNPLPTTMADFIVHDGAAVIEAYQDSATSLGGIIRKLRRLGIEPVPVLAAKARPGGPIAAPVLDELTERLIADLVAAAPDAVCLELHGAMVGETLDDVEGDLLSRLRARLGPDVPITVAFDLHGHCTRQMVESVDFLTAYRTHPHADMPETGERAAGMLCALLCDGVKPVAAWRSLPFLALANDETASPVMQSLRDEIAAVESLAPADLLDISVFHVHPFLDLPGMGQVVLVYADRDRAIAEAARDEVASHLDATKQGFVGTEHTLEEVFATIAAGRPEGPVAAFGDQGDSVLAGSPGDSVDIIRFGAERAPHLRGFAPVFDPAAVAAARAAGVGATVRLTLGASISPMLEPMSVEAEVERLTDGAFANIGRYMTGLMNDHGESAVLRQGNLVFLATSKAPSACDPAIITHAGYDLADFDYVVAKAGNHFKLSFTEGCRCFSLASAGLSGRNPALMPHRRSRPIFPLDPI